MRGSPTTTAHLPQWIAATKLSAGHFDRHSALEGVYAALASAGQAELDLAAFRKTHCCLSTWATREYWGDTAYDLRVLTPTRLPGNTKIEAEDERRRGRAADHQGNVEGGIEHCAGFAGRLSRHAVCNRVVSSASRMLFSWLSIFRRE